MLTRFTALFALLGLSECRAAAAPVHALSWRAEYTLRKNPVTQTLKNQRRAIELRIARKSNPEAHDFAAHHHLITGTADFWRLLNVYWSGSYLKWALPVMIYIRPGMLPSPFETPTMRETRFSAAEMIRVKAVLAAVAHADAPPPKDDKPDPFAALSPHTVKSLGARSKAEALRALSANQGFSIAALPDQLLREASAALKGPPRFLPRGMHKGAVETGLKAIAESDVALRRSKLSELSLSLLEEACAERAIPRSSRDAMLSGLSEWLALTPSGPREANLDLADSTRLTLLALNTVSVIRRGEKKVASAFYTGTGF